MGDFLKRNSVVLGVAAVAIAAFVSAWAFGGRRPPPEPDLPTALLEVVAGAEPATRWAPASEDVSFNEEEQDELYEIAYENPATGFGGDFDVRASFDEDGFAERLVLPDGEVVEEFTEQEVEEDGSLLVTDIRGRRYRFDLSEPD